MDRKRKSDSGVVPFVQSRARFLYSTSLLPQLPKRKGRIIVKKKSEITACAYKQLTRFYLILNSQVKPNLTSLLGRE